MPEFDPETIDWPALRAQFVEMQATVESLRDGTYDTWLPAAPALVIPCQELAAILDRYDEGERTESLYNDMNNPQLSV